MENQMSNSIPIDNPQNTQIFNLPWQEIKEHLKKVITSFPSEYKLIKEEPEKLMVLYTPLKPDTIGKDQILYATNLKSNETTSDIKFEISNENNKIQSFSEFERDKKTMDIAIILLQKSIAGTLVQSISNINNKVKKDAQTQMTVLLIRAAVAIGLILVSIWAFMQ